MQNRFLKIKDFLENANKKLFEHYVYVTLVQFGITLTSDPEIRKSIIENAKGTEAEFAITDSMRIADKEIGDAFITSYSEAIVTIYSIVEAAVSNVARLIFPLVPEVAEHDKFKKASIPFAKIIGMDTENIYEYFYELYEREVTQGGKYGYNRFDAILKPLNIETSGKLKNNQANDIFELAQVRNVVVHKLGIADKKFIEIFPNFGIQSGSRIVIKQEQFKKYYMACRDFVLAIVTSVEERFITPHLDKGEV